MARGEKYKGKAVVVGGSIAGVSCAHALVAAGWEVLVVEKSLAAPTGSSTGAGLVLDSLACKIISSWLGGSEALNKITMPLTVEQNQAVDLESKTSIALSRDENFNFRAAHWADIHSLLVRALPEEVFLWGHLYLSFQVVRTARDVRLPSVAVKVKAVKTGETAEVVADLLVAADGCLSAIRKTFVPHFKLRYSGYCTWRGVLDFTGREDSELISGIRKAYPDIGKCLYFDLGCSTHTVLFELVNKRMNWVWFNNQPEPQLKGNSVTIRVSDETIKTMHEEAEANSLVPEFARLVKETNEPFVNVIYDADPLEQIIWDHFVLVGDAAHPTTPHCARSTNMAITDAAVLGKCLEKFGFKNLQSALREYQSTRLPVVKQQVLHARYLGRVKQGLECTECTAFDHLKVTAAQDCRYLQQKCVPFFDVVPSILRDYCDDND